MKVSTVSIGIALLVLVAVLVSITKDSIQDDNKTSSAYVDTTLPVEIPESVRYSAVNRTGTKRVTGHYINYSFLVENPLATEMPVKFYINKSSIEWSNSVFYPEIVNDTTDGLKKWEIETNGVISVREVDNISDANVVVNFVKYYEFVGDTQGPVIRQMGEGGPTEFYNYSNFTIIEKSEIFVFPVQEHRCQTKNIAAHELGHAIGFGHVDLRVQNIMYYMMDPFCKQNITSEMSRVINELYESAKPDLAFKSADATETGSSIIVNVKVENTGLRRSKEVEMRYSDGKSLRGPKIIPALKPNETFSVTIMEINFAKDAESIQIFLDIPNTEKELDESNNEITLVKEK